MGLELDAFLGRRSELARWSAELPAAIVCPLAGELGMVPLTGELREALAARVWWGDPQYRWAARASRDMLVGHVQLYEFGERSAEKARLWVKGREVLRDVTPGVLLGALQERGIDFPEGEIRLERERTESAAERWAAWAIVDRAAANAADPVAALAAALRFDGRSRELQECVRQRAALRLAERGAAAAPALPALRAALQDRDFVVRAAAVAAMGAIGPAALPVLVEALDALPSEDRWTAADAIGALGAAAQPVLPRLREILDAPPSDRDYLLRKAASAAIESITGSA